MITLFIGGAAAIAQPFTPFQISNDPQDSRFARTDGRYVVWGSIDRANHGELDVLGYDLLAHSGFVVAGGANSQASPDVSNGTAVWEDFVQGSGPYTIRARNLGGGASFSVTNTSPSGAPAISGNTVVWQQNGSNGHSSIHGRRLTDPPGTSFPISDPQSFDQSSGDVDGDLVVWHSFGEPTDSGNIYGRRLSGGGVFPITTDSGQQLNPRVSGHYVVWQDMSALSRIYAKDLTSGVEFPVSSAGLEAEMPAIDGDLVVWRQWVLGGAQSDIWGRLLSGGAPFQITNTATISESQPDVRGNLVVWEQGITGSDNDIWGTTVPEPAAALTMLIGLAMLARRAGRRQ
jgi:beta propeller repeat protein